MIATLRARLSDTIARRFAVASVLTIAATLLLLGGFNKFSGYFSQQSLDDSGLLERVTDLMHVIETAPPAMRASLSEAASLTGIYVDWYADPSVAAQALESMRTDEIPDAIAKALPNRVLVTAVPSHYAVLPAGLSDRGSTTSKPYILAIQLSDGSWLAFTVAKRLWGRRRVLYGPYGLCLPASPSQLCRPSPRDALRNP